jgi:hypothetical protein
MAISTEPGDGRSILPTHGIKLHTMFLLDVSATPINADEREHTLQLILWDVLFQMCFPLKSFERYLAKANPKFGALATGKVRERQHETETLYGEGLFTILNDDALPRGVDIFTEEHPTTIEADRVNVNETVASCEVSLEAVAVTAGDENCPIRSLLSQLISSDLLEKAGLNEGLRQDKIAVIIRHYLDLTSL